MKRTTIFSLLLIILFSLTGLANHSQQSDNRIKVVVSLQPEGELASFEVPLKKSYPDGPNVGIYIANWRNRWANPQQAPRTRKGELVSAFKFYGWMESGVAKILVVALVNEPGAEFASTDERELKEVLLDTYLVKAGQRLTITDMQEMGAKPLELRMTSLK